MPTRTPKATTTAAPRKPSRVNDLSRFANENGSIYVCNNLPIIAVFVIKVDGAEEESNFAAKGDPAGGDVMDLPYSYLKNAQFRRQLQLEIFEIIEADDPDVVEAAKAQKLAWASAQQAKSESDRFIDAQQPKAFSGHQCLAQEGRSQCSEYAIFSTNTRERPPLCSKHAHLASQFTPEETGQFTDGKADVRWNRVSILGR